MTFLFLLLSPLAFAQKVRKMGEPKLTQSIEEKNAIFKDQVLRGMDSLFDSSRDYSLFSGRVTDKDDDQGILKIHSETINVKFFRAGDEIKFRLASDEYGDYCSCFVRTVEKNYFVVYVKSYNPCFGKDRYFRRGTVLNFKAERLAERVQEASEFRVILLKRRRDFFQQLNDINHFIWSYDQQKVKVAADYDRKILELQNQKRVALNNLQLRKKNGIRLQKELIFRLDELDEDLRFYRIDREELMVDRWHLDEDLGLPVQERPQKIKKVEKKSIDKVIEEEKLDVKERKKISRKSGGLTGLGSF